MTSHNIVIPAAQLAALKQRGSSDVAGFACVFIDPVRASSLCSRQRDDVDGEV